MSIASANIDKGGIAERLRYFIKHNFSSVDDAAVKLGTTGNTLRSSYLNGRSIPGPELLIKLSQLGCDIYYLLTGEVNYYNFGLAQRIKEVRTKLKLNREQFATMLDVNVEDVKGWENHGFKPSHRVINILAEKAEVSINWLYTGLNEDEFKRQKQLEAEGLVDAEGNKLNITPEQHELLLKSKLLSKEAIRLIIDLIDGKIHLNTLSRKLDDQIQKDLSKKK